MRSCRIQESLAVSFRYEEAVSCFSAEDTGSPAAKTVYTGLKKLKAVEKYPIPTPPIILVSGIFRTAPMIFVINIATKSITVFLKKLPLFFIIARLLFYNLVHFILLVRKYNKKRFFYGNRFDIFFKSDKL